MPQIEDRPPFLSCGTINPLPIGNVKVIPDASYHQLGFTSETPVRRLQLQKPLPLPRPSMLGRNKTTKAKQMRTRARTWCRRVPSSRKARCTTCSPRNGLQQKRRRRRRPFEWTAAPLRGTPRPLPLHSHCTRTDACSLGNGRYM
jgi:hypothetical protein